MSSSSRDHAPTITGGRPQEAPSPDGVTSYEWKLETGIAHIGVLASAPAAACPEDQNGIVWIGASDWVTYCALDGEFEPAWLSPKCARKLARALNKAAKVAEATRDGVGRDPRPTVADGDKSRDEPNQLRKEVEG